MTMRELDAMQAALDALEKDRNDLKDALAMLDAELIATSEALGEGPYSTVSEHVAALRADVDRLDWLDTHALRIVLNYDGIEITHCAKEPKDRSAIREAIDAARHTGGAEPT